jgi:hypothetical protein
VSHPDSATPKQSLPARHTPPTPLATIAQRTPLAATVGNEYGSRWRCQRLWVTPSTDTPFATRTRRPRKCSVARCACARRQAGAGICVAVRREDRVLATAARLSTKVHRTLPRIGLSALHKVTRMRNIGSNIIYG